nr:hypothetical protein [Candidatus Sigynarchaeota archaeon]
DGTLSEDGVYLYLDLHTGLTWAHNIYVHNQADSLPTTWLRSMPSVLYYGMEETLYHILSSSVDVAIRSSSILLGERDTAVSWILEITRDDGTVLREYIRISMEGGQVRYRFGTMNPNLVLSPTESDAFWEDLDEMEIVLAKYERNNARVRAINLDGTLGPPLFFHEWLGADRDGTITGMTDAEAQDLIYRRATLMHWLQFMAGMPPHTPAYWQEYDNV